MCRPVFQWVCDTEVDWQTRERKGNAARFFPNMGVCINCGADRWAAPRSERDAPGPALLSKNQVLGVHKKPARGPAGPKGTPEGVRPLIMQVCACGKNTGA